MTKYGDVSNWLSRNPVKSEKNKSVRATEEIHLIITYPIMESWEKLGVVDSVRWKTISAVKDLIEGFWPGARVNEV